MSLQWKYILMQYGEIALLNKVKEKLVCVIFLCDWSFAVGQFQTILLISSSAASVLVFGG